MLAPAMCALLRDDPRGGGDDAPDTVLVQGLPQSNSAAKFWWALLVEVGAAHPDATSIELSAVGSGRPDPERLHPRRQLQRGFDRAPRGDPAEELRAAIAELELLGTPGPVQLRVLSGATPRLLCSLPLDAVDAELLLYLLSWLLRWARVPPAAWAGTEAAGEVVFADEAAESIRPVAFRTRGEHLAEGVYRRTVTLTLLEAPA